MSELDKTQSSILAFMFDKVSISDPADTLEFALSGRFPGKYHAAYSRLEDVRDDATVVFTLPIHTNHAFLALTRSKEAEVARLLANIEDYERESSIALRLGEAIIMTSESSSNSWKPFGVILLRTASSVDLSHVPDKETFNGKEISFFLAVPLTEVEWDYRKKLGRDALMDLFQTTDKQLFFS